MPAFIFSNAQTANGTSTPLSDWQYEQVPYPAAVKIIMRATTTGVRATITTGSETIVEESPVQGGGTAGTTPAELNTPPVAFNAAMGDKLKIRLREVAGGTPTVDGIVYIEPLM